MVQIALVINVTCSVDQVHTWNDHDWNTHGGDMKVGKKCIGGSKWGVFYPTLEKSQLTQFEESLFGHLMYRVEHALKRSNMILNAFNMYIIIEIIGVKYRVVKGTFCM